METIGWFMVALAMLATSIVVGAWKMINFKAALVCALLMFISTLYFVPFDEYSGWFMWAVKLPLSNWILLAGLIAMTATIWTTFGVPSGVMTMFMAMTAFTAIISGQASVVMAVAAIAIATVAIAWGVSFITPAQWASAGVWVRGNKLLFALCLVFAFLAIMLMLWVTGVSAIAKWAAYISIALAVIVAGQYAEARHGFYTEVRRVWTTEIKPELVAAGVATEQFVRDSATNYVGPLLLEWVFVIIALVPARIAYLAYYSHEAWATKWVVFWFSVGTLFCLGLQFQQATKVGFDLFGAAGAKIIEKYKVFFKLLPTFWQIVILVGTPLWSLWCLYLFFVKHFDDSWMVLGVWWVIILPFAQFGSLINKAIKLWVHKLLH